MLATDAITWRWPVDKAYCFLAWSRQAGGGGGMTKRVVVVAGAVGLQLCSRPSVPVQTLPTPCLLRLFLPAPPPPAEDGWFHSAPEAPVDISTAVCLSQSSVSSW